MRDIRVIKRGTPPRAEAGVQKPFRRKPPRPEQTKKTRLASKRRKIRIIQVTLWVAGVLLLSGAGFWITHLKQFSINEVVVTGVKTLSPEEIKSVAEEVVFDERFHLIASDNILLLPRAKVQGTIIGHSLRIDTVTVKVRSWRDRIIEILVVERTPAGVWCADDLEDSCFFFDNSGLVFMRTPRVSQNDVLYTGGIVTDPLGAYFLQGELGRMIALVAELKERAVEIERVRVLNKSDVAIYVRSGFVMYVSFETAPSDIIGRIETVFSSDEFVGNQESLEYIDFRFGDRVYYKTK